MVRFEIPGNVWTVIDVKLPSLFASFSARSGDKVMSAELFSCCLCNVLRHAMSVFYCSVDLRLTSNAVLDNNTCTHG